MLNALNESIEQGREGRGGLGAVALDHDGIDDGRKKDTKASLVEVDSSKDKEIKDNISK